MATFDGLKEEIKNLKAALELTTDQRNTAWENVTGRDRTINDHETHIATLKEEKRLVEASLTRVRDRLEIISDELWQEVLLARVGLIDELPESAIGFADAVRRMMKDPEGRTSKPETEKKPRRKK